MFCNTMSHMAETGVRGVDLYVLTDEGWRFAGAGRPKGKTTEATLVGGMDVCDREYMLYLSLYDGVDSLFVGVDENAVIGVPSVSLPDRSRPVIMYGTSILQGGCASRPGMAHTNIIGRMLGKEVINLGFSGGCRGELCIADAIAELEIAALVMEFDHNAPSPEFLAARHEPFFRRYRSRRPETPVLLMSRCDFNGSGEDRLRREIVQRTWLNAVDNGDRKVDFLDGETLFAGPWREECTFDCCHPNDFGAVLMAERIADRLERLLAR